MTSLKEKNMKQMNRFFSHRPRPLAETTKRKYIADLTIYSEYQDETLENLILEAKTEQRTRIVDNILIECDIEDSKLAQRLDDFHTYEKERGIAPLTLDTRMNNIRAFYRGMGVKMLPSKHNNPSKNNPFSPLTRDKIRASLNHCNSMSRAAIVFMACTGIRVSDCGNFKIKDYMDSIDVDDYDDFVERLYSGDCSDLLGYWEFNPQKTPSNVCQVCNTPESNKYIMSYLRERHMKKGLSVDEPLFCTNRGNRIRSAYFSYLCQRINWKLEAEELCCIDEEYELGLISDAERLRRLGSVSKFHAHGLRKFFISTISELCGNLRLLLVMEGHRSVVSTDSSYVRISRDAIVGEYLNFVPALSFEPTVVNVLTDERISEYESRLRVQQERLEGLEGFVDGLRKFDF